MKNNIIFLLIIILWISNILNSIKINNTIKDFSIKEINYYEQLKITQQKVYFNEIEIARNILDKNNYFNLDHHFNWIDGWSIIFHCIWVLECAGLPYEYKVNIKTNTILIKI